MLINFILILISLFFVSVKWIYIKIFKNSSFQTLPGFILLKFKLDFLQLYLSRFKVPLILITGTNGKTSTTHLLVHILKSQNYKVLSNYSGSNLKRGILSTLIFGYFTNIFTKYDFLILEVDEGSVLDISVSIPKSLSSIYLILLNLSRDQLDRYGEVDILASKINEAVLSKPIKLLVKHSEYINHFSYYTLVSNNSGIFDLCNKLAITKSPHLCENLDFIVTLFDLLKIDLNSDLISPYNPVPGRGNSFTIKECVYELHLSKNPVSFNNSLKLLTGSGFNNVLIVMNDNIPDGRDVSWFYDIDYAALSKALESKNVFVSGTRSYDFYNLLKIKGISSFNALTFANYLELSNKYSYKNTFIMANYSATTSISKLLKKYV